MLSVRPPLYPCSSPQEATQERLQDMASWKNSKLMTFDAANLHVKTHFNDQLVVLLREVGELYICTALCTRCAAGRCASCRHGQAFQSTQY